METRVAAVVLVPDRKADTLPPGLAVAVRVATSFPIAVGVAGVKVTCTVQLAPGSSAPPHWFALDGKSLAFVPPTWMVTGPLDAAPVFFTVNVEAWLDFPSATEPKDWVLGLMVNTAAPADVVPPVELDPPVVLAPLVALVVDVPPAGEPLLQPPAKAIARDARSVAVRTRLTQKEDVSIIAVLFIGKIPSSVTLECHPHRTGG